jgi:hypothetical protein
MSGHEGKCFIFFIISILKGLGCEYGKRILQGVLTVRHTRLAPVTLGAAPHSVSDGRPCELYTQPASHQTAINHDQALALFLPHRL